MCYSRPTTFFSKISNDLQIVQCIPMSWIWNKIIVITLKEKAEIPRPQWNYGQGSRMSMVWMDAEVRHSFFCAIFEYWTLTTPTWMISLAPPTSSPMWIPTRSLTWWFAPPGSSALPTVIRLPHFNRNSWATARQSSCMIASTGEIICVLSIKDNLTLVRLSLRFVSGAKLKCVQKNLHFWE